MVRCSTSLRTPDFSLVNRYPELRNFEIRRLASSLLSDGRGRSHTLWSLERKIDRYTRGQLPHTKQVILTLYELVEGDEPVEEVPLPVATPCNQQASSGEWIGLKKALTNSLTSGTFLDSQFYAVESRSSTDMPKIRPLYFCSMVGDNFTSGLIACKPLAEIMRGRTIDPPFQILPKSRRRKRPFNLQTGTIVTSRMGTPVRDALLAVSRVLNGSLIHSPLATELSMSLPASGRTPPLWTCRWIALFC